MSALIAAFIAAGDTTIIDAGRAIYNSNAEYISVRECDELEYYRAVRRFASRGGGRDATESLMQAEIE